MRLLMNTVLIQLRRVVWGSDLNGVRFVLGLAELIWAITLLWPGDTFDRPTYTVMRHVMSENAWAFVFLMTGLMQWAILAADMCHDKPAILFAGWNTSLWLYVVISMYLSVSPPPAAISGELALAFAAGWVFVRSGYKTTGRRSSDYGIFSGDSKPQGS